MRSGLLHITIALQQCKFDSKKLQIGLALIAILAGD
jgi:hypothetical protein